MTSEASHARYTYWLVDPAAIVETFRLQDGQMVPAGRYGRQESFATPLFPRLAVDLTKVF